MKTQLLSVITLFITVAGFAQSKEELAAREFFWGENDAYKNVTEIPEKWTNESAVIIYKNENYDYHKFLKNVTYTSSVRKRIKLLDKAAVEEFSEFTFQKRFKSVKGFSIWKDDVQTFVGVKIVKPDGTEREIDIDEESVKADDKTKLAISNLEVGDIIDYYYYRVEPHPWINTYYFDPVETVLSEEYPIVDFKLFFETENDFFLSFKSFNGAPDLTQLETGKNRLRRYELIAHDLEKREYTRWFYPLVEMPAYKFHVYYASRGQFEDYAWAFLPENEKIIKNSVSKEEVLDFYDTRYQPDGYPKKIMKYLKNLNLKTDAEKVSAAYYYMRHMYLTRYIEAIYLKKAGLVEFVAVNYDRNSVYIEYKQDFIRHFTDFLKEMNLDYEIVIGKKRFDGPISDLLITKNVNAIVKVNTNPPMYAELFGPYTSINEFSEYLEGTDVYLLSASRKKIDVIKEGKLPVSKPADNEMRSDISVNIMQDFSGVSISATNYYKGQAKKEAQADKMYFADYVYEDYEKFETKPYMALKRYKDELDAISEKIRTKQKDHLEEIAANALDVKEVENYKYDILTTGRFGFDNYFSFSESFDAKNTLIKKAGRNYIIELGKLIGGQVDITEKERNRTENIYMPYPRTYKNKVTLKIPEGYKVSGLDKLNTDVENVTGSFKSKAKIEGDNLVLETIKTYNHNYEPKENWDLMIEFLDQANQFTNEKILLKKV